MIDSWRRAVGTVGLDLFEGHPDR
eukprot:SAG31_NODE_24605_length_475_cov_0.725594_1_plen_23_part_01